MSNAAIQTYARVINGAIVEWPVYAEYITRRGDPMSFYTPVIDNGKPTPSPFEVVASKAVFAGTQVVMQYTVLPMPFDMLLAKAWGVNSMMEITRPMGTSVTAPDASKIDPALSAAIQTSIQTQVQTMLDNFAAQKGYSGIASLCGYANSSVPNFAEEGKIGMEVRDQTWASLYSFLAQVTSGAAPFIKDFQDVMAVLPVMSWVPVINGNAPVETGQSLTLTIANYSPAVTYTVAASSGTVVQSSGTLTYTAPSTAGSYSLTVNETTLTIVVQAAPAASSASAPASGTTAS